MYYNADNKYDKNTYKNTQAWHSKKQECSFSLKTRMYYHFAVMNYHITKKPNTVQLFIIRATFFSKIVYSLSNNKTQQQ